MIGVEYRYELHTFDDDGELIQSLDVPGGWLTIDIDRLSEQGGRRVRGLRLREYPRPDRSPNS